MRSHGTAVRSRLWSAALALGLVGLAACSQAPPPSAGGVSSVLSRDEALAMADARMRAFSAGDYGGFTDGWSEAMTEAIPEPDFLVFREQTLATAGEYVSILDATLEPAQTEGSVAWVFQVDFTEVDQVFRVVMPADSGTIEGAFLNPASG